MEEQKVLNVQTNKKIEAVENSHNKQLDIMNYQISRLSNQQQGSEKGNFLPRHINRGIHEIGSASDPNVRIDEVKAVVTLRSGKELRPKVPTPTKTAPTVVYSPEEEQSAKREEAKPSVPPLSHRNFEKKKFQSTKLKF